MEPDEAPEMTMVCAWCARVLVQGTSGEVSHGICDDCLPGVVEEILERLEQDKVDTDADNEDGEFPEDDGPGS